jgi:hypothetical protein
MLCSVDLHLLHLFFLLTFAFIPFFSLLPFLRHLTIDLGGFPTCSGKPPSPLIAPTRKSKIRYKTSNSKIDYTAVQSFTSADRSSTRSNFCTNLDNSSCTRCNSVSSWSIDTWCRCSNRPTVYLLPSRFLSLI